MKKSHLPMRYESPLDKEILEAYFQKNSKNNRADVRKLRKALRKLSRTH